MNKTIRVLITMIMAALLFSVASQASAAPLYVAAHQKSGKVPNPSRFEAIVGLPNQCVKGIPCWTYTKGTRSANRHWPESWYLHVSGDRVKDKIFHLYVMDPRSTGWQQHVAKACAQHCFIDGMGTSSLSRTTPHLSWTPTQWVTRAALVVKAVVHAGKQALPNSVGFSNAQGSAMIAAAGGRGSTEGFKVSNAKQTLSRGRIWVQEIGDCLNKYHAYLAYRGKGDHFACYLKGTDPWDISWR